MIRKIFFALLLAILLGFPTNAFASKADDLGDCYIKNFDAQFLVNEDSTVNVLERLNMDCGSLKDKHGLFRILPLTYNYQGKKTKTQVELMSITDLQGRSLNYTTSYENGTIVWKIGDKDRTIQGENGYLINYKIKNAIVLSDPNNDIFYYDLISPFWTMQIENFKAEVILPPTIKNSNSTLQVFSGQVKNTSNTKAIVVQNGNKLEAANTQTILPKEGITIMFKMPKGIFTPTPKTDIEKFIGIFGPLTLILSILVCMILWSKFGRDPKLNRTIVPEFSIPENLSPLEMGPFWANGGMNPKFVTAAIINLATKGYLKVEEQKGFLRAKKFIFTRLKTDFIGLNRFEAELMGYLFKSSDTFDSDDAKSTFPQDVARLNNSVNRYLQASGLFVTQSFYFKIAFIILGSIIITLALSIFISVDMSLTIYTVISGLIIFIFGFLMPQRTQKGAELLLKIEGFKLYMKTAEKYRQQFNEKENIFEKFLPYAILFGLTSLWIKKMRDLYGEDYFTKTYHPAWFVGASIANFNDSIFNSMISSLSSSMTSASSSGEGGSGGGVGGGAGGGGGGSW